MLVLTTLSFWNTVLGIPGGGWGIGISNGCGKVRGRWTEPGAFHTRSASIALPFRAPYPSASTLGASNRIALSAGASRRTGARGLQEPRRRSGPQASARRRGPKAGAMAAGRDHRNSKDSRARHPAPTLP